MKKDDEETLTVSMTIPARLVHHFDPGKIVELVLPNQRADYFHVDRASWSAEAGHSVALTYRSRESVVVTRGIPRFNLGHAAR